MMIQDENINEDEKMCDDGYCDINNENISEDDLRDDTDSDTKKEFQKFIKKISSPS